MKFKETETKSIGCELNKCSKNHLACCYNCPDHITCKPETMCEIFFLHTKQPFDLRERICKHLTSADQIIWKEMFRKGSPL